MSQLTADQTAFVTVMKGNIRYWRSIHAPITTTTGRAKKVPWFLLVVCPKGHITVTNMKRPVGMRFRCGRHGSRPGKGTVKCERKVEILEIPDMKETCGIDKQEADEIHDTWKGKYT